jgi:trehalose 6-phosphate synthase
VFHHEGIETLVRPFPISTDFTALARQAESAAVREAATRLQRTYHLEGQRICLGLDRFDYTKGIPERLQALDRLLSKSPHYRGHLVFVQAGPESRTRIAHYHDLNTEIVALVEEINRRHGTTDWVPIRLVHQHLDLQHVLAFYRLAEVCVVSALHDGMNLVAKEYVAARTDGDGVLILSQFTGAARELRQALLINPYDRETFADTLAHALEMSAEERTRRMCALREVVAGNNIYRWAGKVLQTLTNVRHETVVGIPKAEPMEPGAPLTVDESALFTPSATD